MGCATPILRRNIEAQTGRFITKADVVEIAADGQIAVAANADKALHQLLDRTAFPVIKLRRGDFGQGNCAQAIGTAGVKHTRRAQVGRDYLGNLAAQRGGVTSSRVAWRRGYKRGNGYGARFGGVELDKLRFFVGWWCWHLRLNCERHQQHCEQCNKFPGEGLWLHGFHSLSGRA